MAWIRAIWSEGNHLEEETIPSTWLVNKEVFWPPFGKNAEAYRRNRRPPGTSWRKFPLVRVKNASGRIEKMMLIQFLISIFSVMAKRFYAILKKKF